MGIVGFGSPFFASFLSVLAASVGYAIIWHVLRLESRARQFFLSSFWFFGVSLIQLSWMTAIEYQGIYIIVVYLALCLMIGVQFGLFTLCACRAFSLLTVCALAALWTLVEWGRLFFLSGFSLAPVGLALTGYTAPMQFASLFGILGLSFWVMLTNLMFFSKKIILFCFVAAAPYLFGFLHIMYHNESLKASPREAVCLVQPGLSPDQKIPLQGRIQRFIPPFHQWERLFSWFARMKEIPKIIVFPEAALPFSHAFPIASQEEAIEMIQSYFPSSVEPAKMDGLVSHDFFAQFLSDYYNADVIIGLDYELQDVAHSSAFCFSPYSKKTLRYDKRILLPLAEYLPFKWLKKWASSYGITSFFSPGKQAEVFSCKKKYAVSICYEETFSHIVREGRLLGAGVLVNITNDGWYFFSRLPEYHFFLGRLRSVENGVPLLRACNTGVTSCIDALGRTVSVLREDSGILVVHMPTYQYKTLYTFWGDRGILVICFVIIGIQLFMLAQKLMRRINFCR